VANTYDRRTFLTHSAATIGGVAVAGTVVDTLLEGVSYANGVNTGTPVTGHTLFVGTASDAPSISQFSGQTGKLDSAGFMVANAVYDTLFFTGPTGTTFLPNLGLKITGSTGPNGKYTVWKVTLREHVKFSNGNAFNAAVVVDNFKAALANSTVGGAIAPLIVSCKSTGTYAVTFTTVLPFYNFPHALSESQIGYIADPIMFPYHTVDGSQVYTYTGVPIGTGPFKMTSVSDWTLGDRSSWVKNTSYWRQDAHGRKLPYLDGITFITQADPSERLTDLTSGTTQIAWFSDGATIAEIQGGGYRAGGQPLQYFSSYSQDNLIAPAMNCVMCNVTGEDILGDCGYQMASGVWHSTGANGSKSPIADIRIRKALAMSIDTTLYLSGVDSNVGRTSNGIFASNSPYYANPGYPAFDSAGNYAAAKALVAAYQGGGPTPNIRVQTISGSTYAATQFSFLQTAAANVGINLIAVPLEQSTLISNAIYRFYEATLWGQFGGVTQDLNYVWWCSSKLANGNEAPGFTHVTAYQNIPIGAQPTGSTIPGTVNFADNIDGQIETAMVAALAATTTAQRIPLWRTVNDRLGADIPYLWLDSGVALLAAASTVQNWLGAKAPSTTSVKSSAAVLTPIGGITAWAQIWLS
jgi:peptide/nickel transport system substrate-binding protein